MTDPTCPYCDSREVERDAAFGSEVSNITYYCRACQTPFERIKYDGDRPDTGRSPR